MLGAIAQHYVASTPLTPIGVANTATFTGTTSAGGAHWTTTDLAAENGTITAVSINQGVAGDIAIFTMDSATLTVRAISDTVTTVVGVNNLTVSLAVVTGDLVGVWCSGGTALPRYAANGGESVQRANAATKPTVGTVFGTGSYLLVGGAVTTRQLVMRSTGTIP